MVANAELQRVGLSGWRTGLANLLRKENRAWWASRRWLVQSILWTVVVNGFVAFLMLVVSAMARMAGASGTEMMEPVGLGVQVLFQVGTVALALGTIVLAQGEIIGERRLGVTEWLLSKPVSRPAYVLSKLLAHGLGVMVTLVGLQSAIGYGLLSLARGEPFPPGPYLVGVTGLAVHSFFYLALTLLLGVVTDNWRKLLGVALGVLLGPLLFAGFLGKFMMLTPWALTRVLSSHVLGEALPLTIWLPIGITAVLSAICVAVALARFERLEF